MWLPFCSNFCIEKLFGGQLNVPILSCLVEQSPSSSPCFWMPQRLWCKEYVRLQHNACSWGTFLFELLRKTGSTGKTAAKTTPWESTFQDIWHTSQWHNRGRNVAPVAGGSACVGLGHKESCGQVSMAGFCNLSPSTELVGRSHYSVYLEVRIYLYVLVYLSPNQLSRYSTWWGGGGRVRRESWSYARGFSKGY